MNKVVLLLAASVQFARADCPEPRKGTIEVIQSFPHDATSFTQGLEVDSTLGKSFLESAGQYGKSRLFRWELPKDPESPNSKTSPKTLKSRPFPKDVFAEGLTRLGEKIYVLSWVNQKGFIFSAKTLSPAGSFHYTGEGWGLTNDTKNLVMSDGTEEIRFLEPNQFKVVRRLFVKKGTNPVQRLNELEWYKGDLLANIWQTDEIVQISAENGCVVVTYDGGKLPRPMPAFLRADVLNGIAYDSKNDLLYLTGKLWPRIYEVRFK